MSNKHDAETTMLINSNQLVDEVMRRRPQTIGVFLKHKMHCVGCPIACFHTVGDACREHCVDEAVFLADLSASAEKATCAPSGKAWPVQTENSPVGGLGT